jgi:hypothetical protein
MPARVLVSNDDGIDAPGLRAVVTALAALPGVEVYVCAPSEERSAQSHAISLQRFLAAHPHRGVDGAKAAFAVDGARPRTGPGAGRATRQTCQPLACTRGRAGPHLRRISCAVVCSECSRFPRPCAPNPPRSRLQARRQTRSCSRFTARCLRRGPHAPGLTATGIGGQLLCFKRDPVGSAQPPKAAQTPRTTSPPDVNHRSTHNPLARPHRPARAASLTWWCRASTGATTAGCTSSTGAAGRGPAGVHCSRDMTLLCPACLKLAAALRRCFGHTAWQGSAPPQPHTLRAAQRHRRRGPGSGVQGAPWLTTPPPQPWPRAALPASAARRRPLEPRRRRPNPPFRPGAPQGVPALAVSLDSYNARRVDDYAPAAAVTAALVQVGPGPALGPWGRVDGRGGRLGRVTGQEPRALPVSIRACWKDAFVARPGRGRACPSAASRPPARRRC